MTDITAILTTATEAINALKAEALALTDRSLATPEEADLIDAASQIRSNGYKAGRDAAEAVEPPVYSNHPDWPEAYTKVQSRLNAINETIDARDQMRRALEGFTENEPGTYREGMGVDAIARQVRETLRDLPPIDDLYAELFRLERSEKAYTRQGGRVDRIRRQMSAEYHNSRTDAENDAYTAVMAKAPELHEAAEAAEAAIGIRRKAEVQRIGKDIRAVLTTFWTAVTAQEGDIHVA